MGASMSQSYIEAVEEFQRVLASDDLIRPALAVRLAFAAKDFGAANGLGENEITGIVTGAAAMFRALTGRPQ